MKYLIEKKADTFLQDVDHCTFFYQLLEAQPKSCKDGIFIQQSCGRACQLCGGCGLYRDCSFCGDHLFLKMAFGNPDCQDKDDCTLLWWAVEFEDSQMVEALLKEGINPNLNDGNPSDFPSGFPFLKALEMGSDNIISHFVTSVSTRSNPSSK